MEHKTNPVESLLEKAGAFTSTSYELLKLKALDKTSDVASSIISRLFLFAAIFILVMVVNIGVALWLGELLGKTYYGFFLEGGFYLLVTIILLLTHSRIKERVSNSIITQALN